MPKIIKPHRWYIVDLRRKGQYSYKLLNKNFESKKVAQQALKRTAKENELFFEVIKGEQAIEFGFVLAYGPTYADYMLKYDYPPELVTIQDRKSYRTKFRRWKRDFKRKLTSHWA